MDRAKMRRRQSKSSRRRLPGSPSPPPRHGLWSVLLGFACGAALLLGAFLFFSSVLVRVLLLVAFTGTKALLRGKSLSATLQAGLEFVLYRLGGQATGEELVSHLRQQIYEWRRGPQRTGGLGLRLQALLLVAELLWAALCIRLLEMVEQRRSR